MTTNDRTYDETYDEILAGACTLPTIERPLRLAEFDELFASAARDVQTIDQTHARIRLTGSAGLAGRVRDLTARETECCSFFTFTITPEPAHDSNGDGDGEAMALDIEVPAAHAEVLAALAQRASTVATGANR
jgi:hypothetical protein